MTTCARGKTLPPSAPGSPRAQADPGHAQVCLQGFPLLAPYGLLKKHYGVLKEAPKLLRPEEPDLTQTATTPREPTGWPGSGDHKAPTVPAVPVPAIRQDTTAVPDPCPAQQVTNFVTNPQQNHPSLQWDVTDGARWFNHRFTETQRQLWSTRAWLADQDAEVLFPTFIYCEAGGKQQKS